MDGTKKDLAENGAVLERLDKMEKLLEEQTKQAKKGSRQRAVQSVLMLCLVLVVALGMFVANRTLSEATRDLPQLIETTTRTMEDTGETMRNIDESFGKVDFEALNESIQQLKEAVDNLSRIGSLFG